MIDKIYAIEAATGTRFNIGKTRGPATNLVVLGLLYCSETRSCRIGGKKQEKYIARVTPTDAILIDYIKISGTGGW